MEPYHKIQTVFKRDPDNNYKTLISGSWAMKEFEVLANCKWTWTEKIDGTNVRVIWNHRKKEVQVRGKGGSSTLPPKLVQKLTEHFTSEMFESIFGDLSVTLYGEGFGNKIQKVGKLYNPKEQDFCLFDVYIGKVWLDREDVNDIAHRLGIDRVETVGVGTLHEAIELVSKKELKSAYGDFLAEGLVMRPEVELLDKTGNRIITKIKHKDFQ